MTGGSPDQPGFAWSASSSTRPSLMLRMLHLPGVRDGVAVLEIGTGTGYGAALLSERLGSEHVTTVDTDPDLSDAARVRFAAAGYAPAVPAEVEHGGPVDIRRQAEQAHARWDGHGRPGQERQAIPCG